MPITSTIGTHRIDPCKSLTIEVETQSSGLRAGVEVKIFTRTGDGMREAYSTNYTTLTLTPDDADELAAMLVAHAFDRRQNDEAREAAIVN